MKVAAGKTEDDIVIGNTFDKYGSSNPAVRLMMAGFDSALSRLVVKAAPRTVHEVGCGEGYWVLELTRKGMDVRGTDFSQQVIAMARNNARARGLDPTLFDVRSIYEVDAARDSADLIVCCEVLEHLDDPEDGLRSLQRVVTRDLILSVPREPLWRVLNLTRGRYVTQWGNTPGHLNHWSKRSFVNLVGRYFDVVEVLSPLPWTMIHCKLKRTA